MKTLADPRIAEFSRLINAGLDAWVQAGRLLCQLTAENPRAFQEVLDANPHLTREVLETFARIGRQELHPALAMDNSAASRRLAQLPIGEQERLYRARITVVVNTPDGPVEKQKRVCDLNEGEARRVIGDDGIRSAAEQRVLLRTRRSSSGTRSERSSAPEPAPVAVGAVAADLDSTPQEELKRLLGVAQAALIEARESLALIRRDHPLDRYITAALGPIGHLRVAANEEELK